MALQQNNGSNVHTFQSEPHAVSSKQKYREQPARLNDSQGNTTPPPPTTTTTTIRGAANCRRSQQLH
jgi:hypothetical protein